MIITGPEALALAIQQKKVPANARIFDFTHPLAPKPQTMAYVIDGDRVRLLGSLKVITTITDDRTGQPKVRIEWPSAQAWKSIAKQYRPIAAALAVELKKLVKVKMGGDPKDSETLAKFGADGEEIPLWPLGIKNDGPTVTFD